MNVVGRALTVIAPRAAVKRAEARNRIEKLNMESVAAKAGRDVIEKLAETTNTRSGVQNSGYSHGGASRRKTWAIEWNATSKSPKEDIEKNRKTLRERSRDLHMNAPLAAASVNSTRTNCVGSGLLPKPRIDHEFIGMDKEDARELEKLIKKEFSLWANSTLCDNNDQNNFYELQQIAFNDWLRNGEEFVLIKYEKKEIPNMPYQLRLKLVEADRVRTPGDYGGEYFGDDRRLKNGNFIMNGVEVDDSGKVIAYHISSTYPNEISAIRQFKWTRVEKRGKRTGNLNILHIFNGERADQYRGVPFLAPVIESLKQLTRYTEAEIMAAVINSLFTIFITTESGGDMGGFGGIEEDEGVEGISDVEGTEDRLMLGNGNVAELKVGEDVKAVESTHPSGNFDSFVSALCTHIGAALEISPEVMMKKFSNNYSASKGALNETWKSFQMRRKWFIDDFCQVIYELWFSEAVSKGRINAPGFFNNPLIRQAYTNAKWNGPSQGQLNPMQEVGAAVKRIENGLSTHEDECASMNGSYFEDNVRTLCMENELLRQSSEIINRKGDDASGDKN